jgi:SAM-dependent methyltransferase
MGLATRITSELAIAWEECACLACGGEYVSSILEGADPNTSLRFLVVRCDSCGLAFTNPRPDVLSISRFYPADYRCHQAKTRSHGPDPLARFLPLHGLGRLLDFGCGGGDFLVRMQSLGWHTVGLDASDAAIANVRNRGIMGFVGTLPHADLMDAQFEAITMRQSLEHVHQPLDVLRAARALLTSGGRLVVTVPNFDGLTSRWFGADWHGLDVPRHLTHFTPLTLRAMLERAGFARIEIYPELHASWIRHSAKLAEQRGHTRARWLKSRLGSTLACQWGRLWGATDSIIAVCQTSHQ